MSDCWLRILKMTTYYFTPSFSNSFPVWLLAQAPLSSCNYRVNKLVSCRMNFIRRRPKFARSSLQYQLMLNNDEWMAEKTLEKKNVAEGKMQRKTNGKSE